MKKTLLASAVILSLCFLSVLTGNAQDLRQITPDDEQKVDSILAKMTIEEKIGQMFMIGFYNVRNYAEVKTLIKDYHIGNVILFERNIEGMRPPDTTVSNDNLQIPKNVAKLTNLLQDAVACLKEKPKVRLPLFIAVDQENGSQLRIEKGVTLLPGNIALGQTRNAEFAFQAGEITASELRAMGIYMNLAPVVDVNTNLKNDIIGDRSFGGNPDIVTPLGVAFMQGLHSGGVIAVGKHFPGHGDSDDDPHKDLPIVGFSRDHLDKFNIPPFKELIDQGVTAMMTAHMIFLNLYKKLEIAVTFNKDVLDTLRLKLGFEGVIIADDLLMGAIMDTVTVKEVLSAIKKAINAGNDMIIIAHPSKLDSVESGRLKKFKTIFSDLAHYYKDASQINESVRRLLLLKMRVNASLDATSWKVNPEGIDSLLRTQENRETAQKIADSSIVLLSEKGELVERLEDTEYFSGRNFPLRKFADSTVLVVSPVFRPPDDLTTKMERRNSHKIKSVRLLYGYYTLPWKKEARDKLWNNELAPFDSAEAAQEILDSAKGAKAIVFGVVRRVHAYILECVVDSIQNKPIFIIAAREPYFLPEKALMAENTVSLISGCNLEPSIESVVKVLYGELKPKTCQYTSVSILEKKWIDRDGVIGEKVVPRPVPNLMVSLDKEESEEFTYPEVLVTVKNIGGRVSPQGSLLLTTEFRKGNKDISRDTMMDLDSIQPGDSLRIAVSRELLKDIDAQVVIITAELDSSFYSGAAPAGKRDSMIVRKQARHERFPMKGIAFLWCYIAGIIGAAVSLVLGTLSAKIKGDQKTKQVKISIFLMVFLLAQATFGLLLYLIIILISNSAIGGKISFIKDLPTESLVFYLICGFIGGFMGKSVLKVVPYFRE